MNVISTLKTSVKEEGANMTTRIQFFSLSLTLLFLLMGGAAFASYPHGNFADNPDACAACHRMHTATGRNLIKDSSGGTCLSCHNNGIAADTDVMNGVYLDDRDATPHHPAWGANLGTLMGGGFTKVGNATGSTSKHRVDETLIPPGADPATGFPYGAAIQLKCTSCHNAHPNKTYPDQYRLLALRPNLVTSDKLVVWNGPWADATQKAPLVNGYRAYTEADFSADNPVTDHSPGHNGEKETTRNYRSGIAEWCAACHTHYMATWTPGSPGTPNAYKTADPYAAGDQFGANARERHSVNTVLWNRTAINGTAYNLTTNGPLEDKTGNGRTQDDWLTCLSCHRAHGTDSVMSGDSILPQAERQAAAPVLPYGTDSMLLRGDRGRQICADCHNF